MLHVVRLKYLAGFLFGLWLLDGGVSVHKSRNIGITKCSSCQNLLIDPARVSTCPTRMCWALLWPRVNVCVNVCVQSSHMCVCVCGYVSICEIHYLCVCVRVCEWGLGWVSWTCMCMWGAFGDVRRRARVYGGCLVLKEDKRWSAVANTDVYALRMSTQTQHNIVTTDTT